MDFNEWWDKINAESESMIGLPPVFTSKQVRQLTKRAWEQGGYEMEWHLYEGVKEVNE